MRPIIIPMGVEAFLKNNSVTEDYRIPKAAPNYRDAVTTSYLGSVNTPQPFNLDVEPLCGGVHLHFIIPDMFTHADAKGDYPAAPNRYLVTRFAVTPGKNGSDASIARFVVESDFISDDDIYGGSATIPMFSDSPDEAMFRYLGRSYGQGDAKDDPDNGERLDFLTAVGAGEPAFAAYYPSSHSVFGFHDRMEGIDAGSSLTYAVTGYFSSPEQDPFHGVTDFEAFQALLEQHSLSVEEEEQFRDRTLLFGEVSGILWEGMSHPYGKGIPTGKIDVSVGNTSAEALSALLSRKMDGNTSLERYLNALQYSLLEDETEADGNFLIDDAIHDYGFEKADSSAGGLEVVDEKTDRKAKRPADAKHGDSPRAEYNGGDRYSSLVKKMARLEQSRERLEADRLTLFQTWELYMYLYENSSVERIPSKAALSAEIQRLVAGIQNQQAEIDRLTKEAETDTSRLIETLPSGFVCKRRGAESYQIPRETVVLLSGEGIRRNYAFGEDGRYTEDQTLLCQTKAVASGVEPEQIKKLLGYPSAVCFAAAELDKWDDDLFCQAALLSSQVRGWLEEKTGEIVVSGAYSPILLNQEPQTFTTLYMDWSVRFYPTRTSRSGEEDNTLSGWEFNYGETGYAYSGNRSEERGLVYTGRTVATPHSVYQMKYAMKKWLEFHPDDEEAKQAADKIQDLPVLSQSLGGLNEQLCGLMHALQFPVIGNSENGINPGSAKQEGDEYLAELVRTYAGTKRISTVPEAELFGMRGGHFRVDRLNLIGTFGQIQQVIVPAASGAKLQEINYSETIRSNIPDYGLLTPGFLTPSRLSQQWVSAGDRTCITSADKSTTPICGFILPELLNRRLLCYRRSGEYIGMMKTVYRNGKSEARWVGAPDLPGELKDLEIDGTLKGFLLALKQGSSLAGIMELIDRNFEKTLQSGNNGLAWGRPLVLARAVIQLCRKGRATYTRKYADFASYNTQGADSIRTPLHFGDAQRVGDGLIAAFSGSEPGDFDRIYPAWGTTRFPNDSVCFEGGPDIAVEDGEALFTFLMEAGSCFYIQTGVLPVKQVMLPAEHEKNAWELPLTAELTSVLTTKGKAELPILPAGAAKQYQWSYLSGTNRQPVVEPVVSPAAAWTETYLCDGLLVTQKEKKDGR